MPPPEDGAPLSQNEIAVIQKWIELGLPEKEGAVIIQPPQPIQPTYTDIQNRILTPKCAKCHNKNGRAWYLPFQTYDNLMAGMPRLITPYLLRRSAIYNAVSGPEPRMPRRAPPLSPEEVAAIKTWIEQGAPNN